MEEKDEFSQTDALHSQFQLTNLLPDEFRVQQVNFGNHSRSVFMSFSLSYPNRNVQMATRDGRSQANANCQFSHDGTFRGTKSITSAAFRFDLLMQSFCCCVALLQTSVESFLLV